MKASPVVAETTSEEMQPPLEQNQEKGELNWLEDSMRQIQKTYHTGKNAVVEGTQWLVESMKEWNGTVQEYLEESQSNPQVQKAWNTLKEEAELSELYHRVESALFLEPKDLPEDGREAWTLIQKANKEGGHVSSEELAYKVVPDWLRNKKTEGANLAEEALSYLMEEME